MASTPTQVSPTLQPREEGLGATAKEKARAKKRWEIGSSSSGGARDGGKETTRNKKRDDIHVPLVLDYIICIAHVYASLSLRSEQPRQAIPQLCR
jgi:hypothetical protein